jgi:1-acyl-sn-glycerol-3-phosphate acyltransferase
MSSNGWRFLVDKPERPGAVMPAAPKSKTGVAYDTDWARRYPVRVARAMVFDNLTLPFAKAVGRPLIEGAEQLDRLDGPAILVANHSSHIDAMLLLTCLPAKMRHRTVVAAAADYFFDTRLKGALWAGFLNSIPMERMRVNRRSADIAASLIEDGWNLLVFPEGGRSRDGWGDEFKGGAAYLAKRCDVPVVPVHLHGTRGVLRRGSLRVRPGKTEVRFGPPQRPGEEDARHFSARLERAVATLSDEAESDWWSARRRLAAGETPSLHGPSVSPWRRSWDLSSARGGHARAGARSGGDRSWPFNERED